MLLYYFISLPPASLMLKARQHVLVNQQTNSHSGARWLGEFFSQMKISYLFHLIISGFLIYSFLGTHFYGSLLSLILSHLFEATIDLWRAGLCFDEIFLFLISASLENVEFQNSTLKRDFSAYPTWQSPPEWERTWKSFIVSYISRLRICQRCHYNLYASVLHCVFRMTSVLWMACCCVRLPLFPLLYWLWFWMAKESHKNANRYTRRHTVCHLNTSKQIWVSHLQTPFLPACPVSGYVSQFQDKNQFIFVGVSPLNLHLQRLHLFFRS